MTIVVTLTCAKLRRWSCKGELLLLYIPWWHIFGIPLPLAERKFYSEPRPRDALPKQFCLIALYEIERTEYYKVSHSHFDYLLVSLLLQLHCFPSGKMRAAPIDDYNRENCSGFCQPRTGLELRGLLGELREDIHTQWTQRTHSNVQLSIFQLQMIQVLVKEVLSRQRTQLGPSAALKAIFEAITEHRILERMQYYGFFIPFHPSFHTIIIAIFVQLRCLIRATRRSSTFSLLCCPRTETRMGPLSPVPVTLCNRSTPTTWPSCLPWTTLDRAAFHHR
jgi:hypothetical protein